jgi:cysteinyl-tRNA synthetase
MLKLQNTLTGELEEFKPINKDKVGMYNCGPTVYDYAHIGNLRAYIFADILKRTLEYNDYEVDQVINITDVGHLTESGIDKVEAKAKKERKEVKDISKFFTQKFFEDLERLDIDISKINFPKATEHINEKIQLIEKLEEKGYTYQISDGLYFDTSKFKGYGKLGGIDIEGLKEGARIDKNKEKKNPTDFALWRLSKEKRQQEWESPWGFGFPGWHVECSAMSMKYLGDHFDIHTGGIDHVATHHNNEIAQSESLTGKKFVNYWLHNAFVSVDGKKISKSLGNLVLLDDLEKKGVSPLAYRYWLLTALYNSPINFTWEALNGAEIALSKLYEKFRELEDGGEINDNYKAIFKGFVNDNLNTPKAVALIWELLKDNEVSGKRATLLEFDKVLGLGLEDLKEVKIPKEVKKLVKERAEARKDEDWSKSDKLRKEISKLGFEVKDTPGGPKIVRE